MEIKRQVEVTAGDLTLAGSGPADATLTGRVTSTYLSSPGNYLNDPARDGTQRQLKIDDVGALCALAQTFLVEVGAARRRRNKGDNGPTRSRTRRARGADVTAPEVA